MHADRSLEAVLDAVAARTPAPGGGSAAAWACALAAGLVEMAAAFGIGRKAGADGRLREVGGRAGALRALALESAEAELTAYAPVLEAMRLPAEDPGRGEQLHAALSAAAEPPLATARTAAEVAELAAEVAGSGSPHLRGDAVAGGLLAEAACRAALELARLNLAELPEDARHAEADALAARAAAARDEALA